MSRNDRQKAMFADPTATACFAQTDSPKDEMYEEVLHQILPAAVAAKNKELVVKCEDLLEQRALTYPNEVSGRWEPPIAPKSEMRLREQYAGRMGEFGFQIVRSREEFPDWLLRDNAGRYLYAEVEYRSSGFVEHGHDPQLCDLVVCWEHDDQALPLPVLEWFSCELIQPCKSVEPKSKYHLFTTYKGVGQTTRKKPRESARLKHEYARALYAEHQKTSKSVDEAVRKTAKDVGYSIRHTYRLVT